jgi:hypothetical protein
LRLVAAISPAACDQPLNPSDAAHSEAQGISAKLTVGLAPSRRSSRRDLVTALPQAEGREVALCMPVFWRS